MCIASSCQVYLILSSFHCNEYVKFEFNGTLYCIRIYDEKLFRVKTYC